MRRLFDDPELPLALRQDLQRSQAAAHDYPVSEKLLQLRAALADSSRQPPARAMEGLGRLSHAGWKLLLVLVVGGSGGVVVQPMLDDTAREQSAAAPQPEAPPPIAAPVIEEPPAAQMTLPPTAAVGEGAPGPRAVPVQVAGAERRRGSAASRSSARREIAQLVAIRGLLDRDPAAAYRLAQRSEQEFPAGLLNEEREALAIIALAKTGALVDARRKANAFVARYPQGPMRAQIEAALEP